MNEHAQSGYQMPSRAISDLVDAPLTPSIRLDPRRKWIAIQEQPSLPSIGELAQPELRIAGLRIDPRANTRSRLSYFSGLTLRSVDDGAERPIIGVPEGAGLGMAQWSPDGAHIALTVTTESERSLRVAEVEAGEARRLGDLRLNGMFGAGFGWMPNRLFSIAAPFAEGPFVLRDLALFFHPMVLRESGAGDRNVVEDPEDPHVANLPGSS